MFDRVILGDRARLLQCLHYAYFEVLGDPLKHGGPTDCCFKRVLEISRNKIRK